MGILYSHVTNAIPLDSKLIGSYKIWSIRSNERRSQSLTIPTYFHESAYVS